MPFTYLETELVIDLLHIMKWRLLITFYILPMH